MKQAAEAVIDKIEKNVELKEHYLSGLQHVYRVDGQYLLILRYSKNKEGHYYFSVPAEFLNNLNIKHLVLICDDAERVFVLPSSQVNDLLEDVEPGNKGWTLDVYDKEGWEMKVAKTANKVLYIPKIENIVSPVLAIIPLQLLAYYAAIVRGCNVDQPRNLAKSVTVE
jgi:glucosamine 6-phosphate synthetase-like amidotransferase/phosphosugar isomerase protein